MSDEPENLVLRYLQRIDQRMDRFDQRLSRVERRLDLIDLPA